jgi:hypothetical protein
LLFGGQSNERAFMNDLWVLDGATGSWSSMADASAPAPGPRHLYAASFDSTARRWFVFGGNTPNGPAGDLWVLEAASGGWSPLWDATGPTARFGPDMVVGSGGRGYLVGGRTASGDSGELWSLEIVSDESPTMS